MNEERRSIKGFEKTYLVSSGGRVKSLARPKTYERILKPGVADRGYLNVSLHQEGKRTTRTIARLVAETFIPNPENKPQVNHINGDKTDNRAENLEWSTGSENIQHAYVVLGRVINKPFGWRKKKELRL